MATKPYFFWGDTQAASAAASDSDAAAVFGSRGPETAAGDTAVVSPELGAGAVARPRMRRNSPASGKQQQQQQAGAGGGGAKKPPQRGLGVAELERLRCGGDPLRELVADAAAAARGHPLLHYHHLQMPPSAFDSAAGARYCSQLLAPAPPPLPGPAPVCFLHEPAAASCQRAPLVAPEQQYFRDRWGRMGGFPPAGNGSGGGADHQPQLLPAPEHPSSQNTIWRPAASSSSCCLHTGHRCDICCRRMRTLAERGALAPTPPASPNAGSNTNGMPDYSIYDLAAAMATARQADTFLALERKGGAPAAAEEPAKKEVREIEFFPAASAQHTGGGSRVSVRGDSELAAPFSSPYGAATVGRTAPQLDLSLRL
ncbi:hypothetical protein C2845_PM05G33080 [Panicum miliaceum]|uniref:Uncharacterized protein n=1 Tax=Panicum miliaceum TaxID=4540 RepID=A0A3L6T5W7_PANMI|nr:hypothetical protein C2845_PM05G33080 [Panicum miliaceum]